MATTGAANSPSSTNSDKGKNMTPAPLNVSRDAAPQSIRKIIFASSAGTMIEWYDFYIFGSLATTIASKFYHTGTPLGDVIAWLATFAIGFVVRPFGAIIF